MQKWYHLRYNVWFGQEIENEIQSKQEELRKELFSCKTPGCFIRTMKKHGLELTIFMNNLELKYIDKGAWKPRGKKILKALFRMQLQQPCGWYIHGRCQKRYFKEIPFEPDLIQDYGGALCHEVKIKIKQEGKWDSREPDGEGAQFSWKASAESEGELAYAPDFQDFYIRNRSTVISHFRDEGGLVDASGSVTKCESGYFSKKCRTKKYSKHDFNKSPSFHIHIEYPPKLQIPHTKISGSIYAKGYGDICGDLTNRFAVTPTDFQRLVEDGAMTIHRSVRYKGGSQKVVLEIEIVKRSGGLARVGDEVAGGGKILEGSSTVFINGKPAARDGDKFGWPGGTGVIYSMGTVFIEGRPAAQAFDVTDAGGYIGEGSQNTKRGEGHPSKEEENQQEHTSELKELEAEMLNALDEKRQIEKELKFERENVSIYQRQIEGHYDNKGDPGTPFGIPGMGAYGAVNIGKARRKVEDLERRLAENEKHILTLWGRRDALEGSQW
jgi:uncharacterized Zn-binding protein involved in type VI secretion